VERSYAFAAVTMISTRVGMNRRRELSNVLQVAKLEILNLKPLEWIERDMQSGKLGRGVLSFDGGARPG